jgi:hypothetical protein
VIDLAVLAERKSVTISDLKRRAEEIHREVGEKGKVYTLRYGEHEDMAVVPLDALVQLAREHAELREEMIQQELLRAAAAGLPVLGGPDEDDLIRERLKEPSIPGAAVIADLKARLGIE